MKIIASTLISVLIALAPLEGQASGLVPEYNTIGEWPVYSLQYVTYYFDCIIDVTDNAVATVYSGDQPIGTGTITLSNYRPGPEGRVRIVFDPIVTPPKGHTCRLVIPEGVIFREDDPAISNDEISTDFYVPETLGYVGSSIEEGSVVEEAWIEEFYFETETAPAGNGEMFFYRKDVPIMKDHVGTGENYDSGLGYARMKVCACLESGVEYTLRLPEGSVSAIHRPDITNEEVSVSFLGGYTGHVEPVMYKKCSLTDNPSPDVLGEVQFIYEYPISLAVNPIVQLYNETDGVVVKEVVPVLSEKIISVIKKQYLMTLDFGNTPLDSGKEYSIIIPEATLVAVREADWRTKYLTVNQCNTVPVGNNSGVSETNETGLDINVENGIVSIEGTSAGTAVKLLTLDGKTVYDAISGAGTVSIPVGTGGIYLLSVNGRTYKIAVR